MEKNFLNITPESGKGNQEVVINVKENMSLDERSESLRIRTSNGVEKQVRVTQDPGMIFFPTMRVSGIQVGQEKKFVPLDHYPVISPQSDKNWLVDSINIGNLLSSFTNGEWIIAFRLRILMRKSFWENYTPEVNQGGSATYYLEDKSEELSSIDKFWSLKDGWVYVGYDWNMDSSDGPHIPSATLDYDPGDGYYKTIFEWIFSDGIDNILPQ